jgi:hypothetical protein
MTHRGLIPCCCRYGNPRRESRSATRFLWSAETALRCNADYKHIFLDQLGDQQLIVPCKGQQGWRPTKQDLLLVLSALLRRR